MTYAELDQKALRAEHSLRDPVDTQSVNFLRFINSVSESLNRDLPKSDYPKLATLKGCDEYFQRLS